MTSDYITTKTQILNTQTHTYVCIQPGYVKKYMGTKCTQKNKGGYIAVP